MPILSILQYPEPRLHRVAAPITGITPEIRRLVDDMAATMYDAPGVGLAATQVDVHKRVVVIDVSETRDQLLVLINPEIVEASGTAEHEEGCLSVPGVFDTVTRAKRIKARALDVEGRSFEVETEGLLAVCIQHEIDHLQGKLFIEYLSRLKQSRIAAKFKKQRASA
ncbi:MAG: peptide deformylase [Burkholderiales bacterium]|nr:peptide deformylase [Burkholderiales bacterium]MDQ3194876.1 peptide deformylase [Pseudomonadota bacterium]